VARTGSTGDSSPIGLNLKAVCDGSALKGRQFSSLRQRLGNSRSNKSPSLKGAPQTCVERIVSPFQGFARLWGIRNPGRCPRLENVALSGPQTKYIRQFGAHGSGAPGADGQYPGYFIQSSSTPRMRRSRREPRRGAGPRVGIVRCAGLRPFGTRSCPRRPPGVETAGSTPASLAGLKILGLPTILQKQKRTLERIVAVGVP
jgi:hypothetical protein